LRKRSQGVIGDAVLALGVAVLSMVRVAHGITLPSRY
jgi:hypothetical protein